MVMIVITNLLNLASITMICCLWLLYTSKVSVIKLYKN